MFAKSIHHSRIREHLLKRAAATAKPGDRLDLRKTASDLGLPLDKVADLLPSLADIGAVEPSGEQWTLTQKGWEQGRNLLRAHRIYESYLADQTGLDPDKWHAEADRLEHILDSETVERIARDLNRPRYDPHGDAIPTAKLDMPETQGSLLSRVAEDGTYRVVHVEDEPEGIFRTLTRGGIAPQLVVEVHVLNNGKFGLSFGGHEQEMDSAHAAAIRVVPYSVEEEKQSPAQGNLRDLLPGEQAHIHSVSPALRGLERRRLLDLGFVPGSPVVKEGAGAFGGPHRFRVRGTVQALRDTQAANLFTTEKTTV